MQQYWLELDDLVELNRDLFDLGELCTDNAGPRMKNTFNFLSKILLNFGNK